MVVKAARRSTAGKHPADGRKDERVELRTTSDEKRLLVAAAVHEHLDVTAFVLRTAIPAAREVVDRASRVHLSARDAARVLELLEHPPEPAARLRRAAEALQANQAAVATHDAGGAGGSPAEQTIPDGSCTARGHS